MTVTPNISLLYDRKPDFTRRKAGCQLPPPPTTPEHHMPSRARTDFDYVSNFPSLSDDVVVPPDPTCILVGGFSRGTLRSNEKRLGLERVQISPQRFGYTAGSIRKAGRNGKGCGMTTTSPSPRPPPERSRAQADTARSPHQRRGICTRQLPDSDNRDGSRARGR